MNLIFQIMIIAYLFFVVPFLIGVLQASAFKTRKKSVSEIFTNGYLIMLTLFWYPTVFLIMERQALSLLATVWMGITLVLCVLAILVGRKQIKETCKEITLFWREKDSRFLLISIIISIVISIGFTKPDAADVTVEIVDVAIETDSMYQYDAYSGYYVGYAGKEHTMAPIEMFYAVGASLAGMEADVFVYRVLPVSVLLLFFLTIWRLGKVFFESKSQQIQFAQAMMLLYWMSTYMQGRALVTGVFLNCWNGLTILSNVILPFTLSILLTWMKGGKKEFCTMSARWENIIVATIAIMAGQLVYYSGGLYVALMFFLYIAVMLVKGGYAYVIKTGCFKKRV